MRDQARTSQKDMDAWLDERRSRWSHPTERWEDVEPVHRVGWGLRDEYRDHGWSDVEPHYRRRWSEQYPDKPWDRVAQWARDVWDDLTAAPGREPHARM